MKHRIFHLSQERRPKPFVLLEIGMLHLRLQAIHAEKDPVRIAVLREEFLTPGESAHLLDMVRNMLEVDTEIRDLAIVINSSAIRHQILSIPPMSKAERQKVLQMDMKTSSPLRESPGTFSFWSAGKIKDQDTVREQVLCAEINQTLADGLIAAARNRNFKVIGFTTYAQMASQLLKECRLEGSQNIALLEASDREGSITLFHSNIWNMDRHFLLGGALLASPEQNLSELDAEKLKLEIGRALQYFKQQVRSENISQIFLFGATRHAASIKRLLEASFRIPVVPIVLERKRFAFNEMAEAGAEAAPLYEIAHASALHAHFERYINFLPLELHGEEHFKIRQLSLAGSAVALYALMGGVAFMMNQEASRISARIQATAQIPPAHAQTIKHERELQISRGFALATEQSEDWLRHRHHLLAELARELASAAPPQMRITGLEVTGKGEDWLVKLDAEIRSPNGSRSQKLLLQFQDKMRKLSCLKQLTWGDVQLTDSASPSDSGESELSPASVLSFTMSGSLNRQTPSGKPTSANS
jgi:hypothetical protein